MSAQPKKRVRNDPEKGSRCVHTCPGRHCEDKNVPPDGHSRRHASGRKPHKLCTESCPGWKYLRGTDVDLAENGPASKKRRIDEPGMSNLSSSNSTRPTRRYRTLFVIANEFKMPRKDVTNEYGSTAKIDWGRLTLKDDEADFVLGNDAAKELVYLDTEPDEPIPSGHKSLYIHEFLYMAIRWNRGRFVVTLMGCDEFCDLVIRGGNGLALLADEYDWVYGGAGLTVDPRDGPYKVPHSKWRDYESNLREISQKMVVWPPVDECLYSSRKLDVIKLLDEAASMVTHTPRPLTWEIRSWDDVTGSRSRSHHLQLPFVIKREASGCSNSIFLPMEVNNRATRKTVTRQTRWRWLAQSYVSALRDLGEWRVFVVGRKLHSVLATSPRDGDWLINCCSSIYSPAELQKIYQPGRIDDEPMHRDGGTLAERGASWREMRTFVEATVYALIERERRHLNAAWLSLEQFCRIDVSVMFDENGNLGYFVNEVTRGHCASIFMQADAQAASEVMDEMSDHFSCWLDAVIEQRVSS